MSVKFTAPTGRMVWGDAFKPEPVMDDLTKQPKRDAAGEVMMETAFGVAYAKNDPAWPAFREQLKAADRAAWPQFHGPDGNVLPGVNFADKITDGDSHNKKGQPRAREGNGYAGCWVVKYATRFSPTVFRHDGTQWVQETNPAALQPGDYVQVSGSTQSNNSTQSPGMYRNVDMVAIVGKGVPIVRAVDPGAAFGAAPPPLPPGASHVPQAPPVPLPAAMPPSVAPALTPPAPAPGYGAYAAPPAAPAAPLPPPVPAAPPAPPPSPARHMTPAAGATTYEQYIAAGWSDAQLIQAGFMTDHVPV